MNELIVQQLLAAANKYDTGTFLDFFAEDALAFLTDAGLVGRLTMSRQGRWPKSGETDAELQHKLGECMWWLTVLADRMDLHTFNPILQCILSGNPVEKRNSSITLRE